MPSFLAIYHGKTVGSAYLVAVTADQALVLHVACKMLNDPISLETTSNDPVSDAVIRGRREALELISNDCEDQS